MAIEAVPIVDALGRIAIDERAKVGQSWDRPWTIGDGRWRGTQRLGEVSLDRGHDRPAWLSVMARGLRMAAPARTEECHEHATYDKKKGESVEETSTSDAGAQAFTDQRAV